MRDPAVHSVRVSWASYRAFCRAFEPIHYAGSTVKGFRARETIREDEKASRLWLAAYVLWTHGFSQTVGPNEPIRDGYNPERPLEAARPMLEGLRQAVRAYRGR